MFNDHPYIQHGRYLAGFVRLLIIHSLPHYDGSVNSKRGWAEGGAKHRKPISA